MAAQRVICIIGVRCPAQSEGKFNDWYEGKHVPDLIKSGRVKRVIRYKMLESGEESRWKITGAGYPRYITIYEFNSRRDYELWNTDPALAAPRQEAGKMLGETGAELFWRVQYESIKVWEPPRKLQNKRRAV